MDNTNEPGVYHLTKVTASQKVQTLEQMHTLHIVESIQLENEIADILTDAFSQK